MHPVVKRIKKLNNVKEPNVDRDEVKERRVANARN